MSSWALLFCATAIAIVTIALFPGSDGDSPPLASLALIGAVVTGATTPVIYAIVRRDLGLPARVAAPFAVAFLLIAMVKFVLAPQGLYEVNAVRALEDTFGTVADPTGAVLTAAAVFALYALGYWIAFRVGYDDPLPGRRRRDDRHPSGRGVVIFVVLLVIGIVLTGGGLLVLGLVLLNAPRQYLEFVFSSWAGAAIALALVVAAYLFGWASRRFDRSPELLAEVGSFVALFWVGLGFLALYHVLWIVYVLVLGSIWPLRTVTPK